MFLFYSILLFYFISFCKDIFFFIEEFTFMSWIYLTVVAKLCFFNVFQYVDQVNCKKENANSCTEPPINMI